MVETILKQNVWMYVIAAAGVFGIGAKLILNGWLKGLIKGTGYMRSTRKRPLIEIRKRYEELEFLDVGIQDTRSFVDRYICSLKLGKTYAASWDAFCKNMMLLVTGTGIVGMWQQYKNGMQAETYMQTFVAGVVICAGMQMIYNVFDSGRKRNLLAAELVNYLDNSLSCRLRREREKAEEARGHEKAAVTVAADGSRGSREAAAVLEPNVIDIDAALARMDTEQEDADAESRTASSVSYTEHAQKKKSEKQKKSEQKMQESDKLTGRESPRKVTEEQIAACDALFDKLLSGISTT